MSVNRLVSGQAFPDVSVPLVGGGEMTLGKPKEGKDWQVVVVFRGKHCPICTRYLGEWNAALGKLAEIGVDLVAVTADTGARTQEQIAALDLGFPVGYDLSETDMARLGLYASQPRNEREGERPFSEPGLFVVNGDGVLLIADISNVPFARPAVSDMVNGLGFIKDPANDYPIRGTHVYTS